MPSSTPICPIRRASCGPSSTSWLTEDGARVPYDVKLPDIGEGIAEGEIVKWLVQPGDAVREDQPLVEVMTDKASVEIPSPRAGVIAALHAAEGAVVNVGSVIVSIALAGEAAG